MKPGKIQAPQSSTGLMRFYDVNTSNIQLDPKVVVGFAIAVIIVIGLLEIIK
ncbi:preprotein translocase subunit Sec61beta [Candidatus Micrarchaeota archaeon CG_4_10_14_0_2_um_filter_60_11]|nr:MAG: preprotein translocase subunit Sec61beta [Candidatus Micrarchaeota archaeon CG10_big_fil_rev_8_21_14_0_10_60_32]PIO02190.1 MAG: preprotein translocase subunit Sec61beta [Candidatus Micrarchaeota archaeon CG09_land_8_20_14_0_10_60_16]PIY91603.1 MAG: preprotein translocase subunit Sec61beta [Candidatus Micrarchaeota archaeon CG_4_10_14_0_8_um_filter_60_7]PIZ90659.1 MAG: preprotein translocase subunit Sec61beta [Candidatus Micrarchaeota archaeon CG_4_10_14_0_2_um_filter_60_11]